MIKYENHLGVIEVSPDFLINLVGRTVVDCFGVVSMAKTNTQKGIFSVLKKDNGLDRGISIKTKNNSLSIDLHIIVLYGTNISAIVKSIMNKVSYTVEDVTGCRVSKVNVFIDGMKGE